MIRALVLSLFCILFVGGRCATAGVMLDAKELGTHEDTALCVTSISTMVVALLDDDDSSRQLSHNKDSMADLSGPVTSVSAVSGTAIAAVFDNFVPSPQIGVRLSLLNSTRPPSPDLDGLIKPPQKRS